MSVRRDPRNKRWYFRKQVALPDGTRRRIFGTPTVNTKKAAEHAERVAVEELLNPALARRRRDAHAKANVPTVSEYAEVFMTSHSLKHKPSSVKSKRQILNSYVLPVFGDMPLDSIRQIDVDIFQADMLETRARKTVNNICSVLSSVLKYAKKNGVIDSVGLSFFLKSQPSELRAVSQEEIEALLGITRDQRYRVAILLASDAGMRVGELRAVRWSDINELRRSICIAQAFDVAGNLGSPKSWKSRTVPMSDRLFEEIRLLEQKEDFLLTKQAGGPLSYWAVRDKIHDLYDAAGINKPPKVWHCLRHSFCTLLAEAGAPVHVIKELAGHASIETTLRYMHTSESAKTQAIAGAFGRSPVGENGSRVAAKTYRKE